MNYEVKYKYSNKFSNMNMDVRIKEDNTYFLQIRVMQK